MTSNRLTRSQAIKKYCKDYCCAGDLNSWKECSVSSCFLWKFRLGKETLGNSTSFKKSSKKTLVLPLNFTKNEKIEGGMKDD